VLYKDTRQLLYYFQWK